MDTAEALLIIEQNRQTHDKLDTLAHRFEQHVVEDRAAAALVAKHERYFTTSVRVVKWAVGVAIASGLSWLGLKG